MSQLTLPQETSWKLLSVSPDMMDTRFGNKTFPFRWRSSLAISAFEPDPDIASRGLCEGRLTFLKVTATITGYQPSADETRAGFASFPDVPTEDLQQIIDQYFACYGALLTVAVFPPTQGVADIILPGGLRLDDYPHIIDVEPKTRELIQGASVTGEILTASKSNIKTNKILTHTSNSETGWSLTGGLKGAIPGAEALEGTLGANLSHKDTETDQENWSVATDASRERQEKEGTVTQISQLYNLLSSYHIGTNRGQFLMLARPHVLEPTEHRTFVGGLRQIEGVQEFILIVARPPDMPGLCIEAQLETGHFPEGLIVDKPEAEFELSSEVFKVIATAPVGWGQNPKPIDQTHDVEAGWVVDTRPIREPDEGHPGMREIENDKKHHPKPDDYNYRRIADGTVLVSGQIGGRSWSLWETDAKFDRTYEVFTRSIAPKTTTGGGKVPHDRLLITSRSLSVCFQSGQAGQICPVPIRAPDPVMVLHDDWAPIVAEVPISIPGRIRAFDGGAWQMPAAKALLSQVQKAMTTSWRLPQRRPTDEAPGFLESDYFRDRIKKYLPRDHLAGQAAALAKLDKRAADKLGKSCTVADALDLDLRQFSQKAGLTIAEAVKARRTMLGIRAPEAAAQ